MKYIFIAVLCLACFLSYSQSDEELGDIAKVVCDCMNGKELNFKDRKAVEMALGMCFLQVIQDKKLDIEITDQGAMENFGRSVGMRMAGVCPKVFEAFIDNAQDNSNKEVEEVDVSGTVRSVDTKEMTTLVVRDQSGKEHKLVWLHYFVGSDNFVADPKKLVGKNISVSYRIADVYSFSQKSYITVKELTKMSLD